MRPCDGALSLPLLPFAAVAVVAPVAVFFSVLFREPSRLCVEAAPLN